MNPLYVETFRGHRRLFVGIVIAAVASAMWMGLGAPKMYRSGVTLYADAPGADSLNGATATPAAQEQTTLNELLTTHHFRSRAASRGPLPAYLKSHSVEGWGPAALLASLRGGGGALDARIDSALSPKRVISNVLGPHVLEITYDAPSPVLATKTLEALVREYEVERVALPDEVLASYQQELQRASAAVSTARRNLSRYVRRHPNSAGSSELGKLVAAEQAAKHQLAGARKTLQSASSDPASQPIVRVIDPPTAAAPTTGHKQLVKTMIAGLFAGLLVSALGIVALTKRTQLVHGPDAVDPDLDFERMSDAELARLLQDVEVDEEWPTATNGQHDELSERHRTPSD